MPEHRRNRRRIGWAIGSLHPGRARGHKVTLFEKNEWVGGKAAVHQENGFRFDMGPTILAPPSVLKRIFREANRNLEDYMELVALILSGGAFSKMEVCSIWSRHRKNAR